MYLLKGDIMNNPSVDKVHMVKVILVGDSYVGKTTIRKRFMGEGFTKSHISTLGADYSSKKIILKPIEGELVGLQLQIWDIAGQATFAQMRKKFLVGAKIVIFVYDRTNKESFYNIDKWMGEVVETNSSEPIPLIIVGNKSDLTENLVVESPDVERYIKQLKAKILSISSFVQNINTSALTGKNIENLFEFASKSFLMVLDKNRTWIDAEIISDETVT